MFRKRSFVSAVLGLAVLVSALPAVEKSITLEEAVAQALDKHPAVVQARLEVDAARGRRMRLTAIPTRNWPSKRPASRSGIRAARKSSAWASARSSRIRERGLSAGTSGPWERPGPGLEPDRARNVVRGRVERAYFEAAFAQKNLADLDSLLLTLEDYTGLAVQRYKAGEVAYLDVVRGRLETLRARNRIIDGRRLLKEKTLALSLLMGDSGYTPMSFSTPVGFAPLGRTWEELKATRSPGRLLSPPLRRGRKAGRPLPCPGQDDDPAGFRFGLLPSQQEARRLGRRIRTVLASPAKGAARRRDGSRSPGRPAAVSTEARTREVLAALERSYADALALEEQIRLFQDSLLREVEES